MRYCINCGETKKDKTECEECEGYCCDDCLWIVYRDVMYIRPTCVCRHCVVTLLRGEYIEFALDDNNEPILKYV